MHKINIKFTAKIFIKKIKNNFAYKVFISYFRVLIKHIKYGRSVSV